eukprot:TRINITY_DN251_c3_g2_i2.p2 TRINITY_DN251_c3_g2~~TRINITY_DN251_c3_g2_i2.p2  ORF type:complete len:197 (-),score=72.19 TRINITY_DN251_c3_g2_i2:382-972(-)
MLDVAECMGQPKEHAELQAMRETVKTRISSAPNKSRKKKKSNKSRSDSDDSSSSSSSSATAVKSTGESEKTRLAPMKKLLKFYDKYLTKLEQLLDVVSVEKETLPVDAEGGDALNNNPTMLDALLTFVGQIKKVHDKYRTPENLPSLSCRVYRRATAPYLKFIKSNADLLADHLNAKQKLFDDWTDVNSMVRSTCR